MPPNPPTLFMPRKPRPPQEPTGPTSPRVGMEELKREMIQNQPELYQNEGPFGPIPDIQLFTTWASRDECAKARMHTSTTAGISGGKEGAYSIVMSGGYKDDVDNGETITYTGTGGYGDGTRYGGGGNRSWGSGIQIENQSFEHKDNKSLYVSYQRGKPVRVIRGSHLRSKYAPRLGYRYDGIYKVTKAYTDKSSDGYEICRYELVREPGQLPIPTQ